MEFQAFLISLISYTGNNCFEHFILFWYYKRVKFIQNTKQHSMSHFALKNYKLAFFFELSKFIGLFRSFNDQKFFESCPFE